MALGALVIATPAAQATDKNCSDFDTQQAAQIFFNNHNPNADPHNLDGTDNDVRACESNPCPCYYGSGGGNNGGDNGTGGGGTQTKRERAKVIRVIDGDTVKVKIIGGARKDVRLIGIDTPEVYGGTECWGPRASKTAKKLLPRGTRVRLTSDPTQDLRDRYGRILRYVTKGRTDINRKLVRFGHAKVYVYNHNPFKRTRSYNKAQRQARSHSLGLWGHC
jgi:endonuclease YncB( thermonuclease family)